MNPWKSGLFWLVLALAIGLCLPLTHVFWFDSHEYDAYVIRTVEYATAFEHGDYYPRWLPNLYGGYGSPFANFYAPGVTWLGALFMQLVGSPTLALKLVVVLSGLLAAGSTFALAYQESKRDEVAFLAACLYTVAPYRVAEVGWRGDLAELLALGMLPAALFAYRRIALAASARLPTAALLAVLTHAGLVMSHTLMGLWGTGLIAVAVLLSAYESKRARDRTRIVVLASSFVAALLVSSVYTMPAMVEKSGVRTETMTVSFFAPENNGLELATLFANGAHQIAPLLSCSLLVFALAWWRRGSPPVAALPWLVGSLCLVLLTLRIAAPLWAMHLIPFGAYMQFPWRLLGPASLVAAVGLSLAWAHALPSPRVAGLLALPLVIAAALLGAPRSAVTAMAPDRVTISSARLARTWNGATVLDEYLPRGVTHPAGQPATAVAISTPHVDVKIEQSAGTRHTLSLDATRPGALVLALHWFPGWAVTTREGPSRVVMKKSPHGLVSLNLPAAGHYRVTVYYGSTPVRRTALTLCLLSLLGIWPAVWLLVRHRLRRESSQRAVVGGAAVGDAA